LHSIAVCFLHSYANPSQEIAVREIIQEEYPGVNVTLSSSVAREYREYERTSSTLIAAYIRPIVDSYFQKLESELRQRGFNGSFWVMRSSGGAMSASFAREAPLASLFSGPAGGIAAASYVSRDVGRDSVISFDVGGTSLDACIIRFGQPSQAYEAKLEHMPILTPVLDLRTIGAGGGSIARVDDGFLKVGPESAGAVPGPSCYVRGGTEATLTDSAAVLGYLQPKSFLGGRMSISLEHAREAVTSRVATPLRFDIVDAAAGTFRVAVNRTVGALREITIENGLDPREFDMVAFGGFGPILAPMILREMGLRRVLVPAVAGVFSAWGMLVSDLQHDTAQTVMHRLREPEWSELESIYLKLENEAREVLRSQGVSDPELAVHRLADLRYRRQEHTLTVGVPFGAGAEKVSELLDTAHLAHYGHVISGEAEVVTLRVHATASRRAPVPEVRPTPVDDGPILQPEFVAGAYDAATGVFCDHAFYARSRLLPGHPLPGPAVVLEDTATTVIGSDQGIVFDGGNLVITDWSVINHA
jgi:N-methylhydantoinase A